MFDVLVTFRNDFSEQVIDRYPSREEAEDAARRLAQEHNDKIVRAWVRGVRKAKAKS